MIPDPATLKKTMTAIAIYDRCGRPGPSAKNDDERSRNTYPGGKGGSGVYQKLINLIPPHETYIETHLGGGAIMKKKGAAKKNIGIDIDPEVAKRWNGVPGVIVINTDATRFLKEYQFRGREFVYADPPYLMETRKSGKLYNFEYTDDQHIELLDVLVDLPCMVMVSGYWSDLYAKRLKEWNVRLFEAATRQGLATEWVWFNYPDPVELHDYSFLGDTFRDRERIKRKRQRWVKRLMSMSALERNALLESLNHAGSTIDNYSGKDLIRINDDIAGRIDI
jgi:hypothetical protein